MNEHLFWNEISAGMGNSWQATRIESHSSAPGFPDVDYCMNNGEQGHLEIKFGYNTDMPHILDSQIKWHMKRYDMNGLSFFLSKIKYRNIWYYLIHRGRQCIYLKENKTINDWIEVSVKYWLKEINFSELKDILKGESYNGE